MINEDVKIRPYARLLTMLGDQLIKNEQIAVIELIKNSYDAEAEWVKVSFENFGPHYQVNYNSKIIIEDNGTGMTKDIIKKSWMSPATPNKYSESGEIRKSINGKRIIQGEKGIGRFAMLKLGRRIKMTTKPIDGCDEYSVLFDLTRYDDNFLTIDNKEAEIYLDQLDFELVESKPSLFVERDIVIDGIKFDGYRNTHGTRLEISDLRGKWSDKKVYEVIDSFVRFSYIFDDIIDKGRNSNELDDIKIGFFENGIQKIAQTDPKTQLQNLLNQKTVIKVTNGHYCSRDRLFTFEINSMPRELYLYSPEIASLKVFKDWFLEGDTAHDVSNFGDFDFDLFIFDFNAKGTSRYALSQNQKDLIKKHRIYLLRDDIRVLPYGDPDDDWLQIDIGRGTISAGSFFSNDQVVGRIKITKAGNPHLKDKTNREGLIEDEYYTSDFICVIRSLLSFLRIEDYKEYLKNEKNKKDIAKIQQEKIEDSYSLLVERYKEDRTSLELLSNLRNSYETERSLLQSRMSRSEHLAAVGLSVETSNHDIMMMMLSSLDILTALRKATDTIFFDINYLNNQLDEVIDLHKLIISQLRDMQGLFVSSKQRPKWQPVKPLLDKILKIYKRYLSKNNINVQVETIGKDLQAFCIDADIMQLLINLLDNAIFWLKVNNKPDRQIKILLDEYRSRLIFSDNGCGIKEEDRDYIFEPFFSTKGEDGKGLGLYISRRLLERNNNYIRLAENYDEFLLNGATFIVDFKTKE